MAQVELSVVIVNYNGGAMILSCIESIIRETRLSDYQIIVVDNDSSDESIDKICQKYPEVLIIENNANLGFAAANNVGFRQAANSEYILVLNPDTKIINGAIDSALSYIKVHEEVGVLGCKVLFDDGKRQSTLIRFPSIIDTLINIFIPNKLMRKSKLLGRSRYVGLDEDEIQDVDVVAGCFMLLPIEVINDVGGMDDDFFMFGEEIEWCHRIIKSGRKVRYFPDCTIIHHGGGCSESLSYRKVLLIAKGQLMVLKKTKGSLTAYITNIIMLLRDIPRALLWAIIWLVSSTKANKIIPLKTSAVRLSYHILYLFGIDKKI